jgi:hypothetical protein
LPIEVFGILKPDIWLSQYDDPGVVLFGKGARHKGEALKIHRAANT